MAPPLMGHFMGGYIFKEGVRTSTPHPELMAERAVQEGRQWHVHQHGPGLTEAGGRLLSHGDSSVGQWPKHIGVKSNGILGFHSGRVHHAHGVERTQSRRRLYRRVLEPVFSFL